jgi:hypothetical protein
MTKDSRVLIARALPPCYPRVAPSAELSAPITFTRKDTTYMRNLNTASLVLLVILAVVLVWGVGLAANLVTP